MKDIEFLLKALADRNRLRILALLKHKKMCVCELAYILGIAQPSVSRHLKKLKSAGLVLEKQESFWTDYSLLLSAKAQNRSLLDSVLGQLSHQSQIKSDRLKAKNLDRKKLCSK
jgi:ArsR family transcriptional regulator